MQKRSLCVLVALWLVSGVANALPTGPIVSGNGQLEFSNFQFFSPFHTVDEGEVSLTVLPDGITLSGPVSATDDLKSFFVLYEVRALGAGIVEASLQLDSDVDADKSGLGLVLATKRLVGDKNDPRDWFGDKDKKKGKHGGKGEDDDFGGIGDGFPFGGFGHKNLAFLKTADWEFNKRFGPHLGLGKDGAIRLVEAGFAVQQSLRVVEHVVVASHDGIATWNESINRFTVVPEPGTATLMVLGLGLLAARSRRSR